jgi:hypothetical protein
MRRRLNVLALAVAGVLAPSFARGQEAPAEAVPGQPQPVVEDTPGPTNDLAIHGSFTNTLTTHYVTRGVLLEDQGVIYQNVAELYFTFLDEEDAPVSKVTGIIGIFNSVHEAQTGAGSLTGADPGDSAVAQWFEFDFWAGASVGFGDFTVTGLYQEFHSPNDAFDVCENVQLKLSYADADLWGDSGFALNPYVIGFLELDGKAGTGADEGLYLEVGVGPSFPIIKDGDYPVTLTVPLTAGFGFDDFYEDDEEFGFVSVGAVASVPLAFIPPNYGSWTLSSGVYYYYYGDGVDDFNTGIGNDDDYDIVGTIGVGLTF